MFIQMDVLGGQMCLRARCLSFAEQRKNTQTKLLWKFRVEPVQMLTRKQGWRKIRDIIGVWALKLKSLWQTKWLEWHPPPHSKGPTTPSTCPQKQLGRCKMRQAPAQLEVAQLDFIFPQIELSRPHPIWFWTRFEMSRPRANLFYLNKTPAEFGQFGISFPNNRVQPVQLEWLVCFAFPISVWGGPAWFYLYRNQIQPVRPKFVFIKTESAESVPPLQNFELSSPDTFFPDRSLFTILTPNTQFKKLVAPYTPKTPHSCANRAEPEQSRLESKK